MYYDCFYDRVRVVNGTPYLKLAKDKTRSWCERMSYLMRASNYNFSEDDWVHYARTVIWN